MRLDETVVCWGYDGFGQINPPTGDFTLVRAGDSHTCGLRIDGSVECWGGNNAWGQLDVP